MKNEYIITNDELLSEYGLDLNSYAIDSTFVPMIIKIALGKAVSRILYFNDNFAYESSIESSLDNQPLLVPSFKKLQFQVIYNLIFLGDSDPIDMAVDEIICSDLRWGKINGFQKQVFVR